MGENLIREDGFYQTFLALIIHHSITIKNTSTNNYASPEDTKDSLSQSTISADKSTKNSAPILEPDTTENNTIPIQSKSPKIHILSSPL